MSNDLQIAVCGSTHNNDPTPLCLPSVDSVILSDFTTLRNYVISHSKSHSIIVVILDLNDQNSSPVLEDLKKQTHLFAIFICVKRKCQLTVNGGNVFPVSKQLLTRKITLSVVQFFEDASKRLLALNQIAAAFLFKQKANTLKQQRFINGKVLFYY